MINIQKFLTDEEYRTNEVYPSVQNALRKNWNAVWTELRESRDLMFNLYKLSKGQTLTEAEAQASREQLKDIAKIIPAISIFLLPGGIFILAILGKILPWDLVPSAFKEDLDKEYSHSVTPKQHESEKVF